MLTKYHIHVRQTSIELERTEGQSEIEPDVESLIQNQETSFLGKA